MSLFGSDSDSDLEEDELLVAQTSLPPIPGLLLFRSLIPTSLQGPLALSAASLFTNNTDQVMLFESPATPSLPAFLDPLLAALPSLLSALPRPLHDLLFASLAPRQVIVNLYPPGEGITSHVDLPNRYADGIVGVSLLGSAVMEFSRVGPGPDSSVPPERHAVLLRPGDCYVFYGEARYGWTHGIPARKEDAYVERVGGEVTTLCRRTRISVTLRRMKEGADVVGSVAEGEAVGHATDATRSS